MNEEDKPQPSTYKEKKAQVDEGISITEDIIVVLKRVDQLLDKAKEREKEVEILEQERKKDEEALKEIRRRYNIIT